MTRMLLRLGLLATLLAGHGLFAPASLAATTCTATSTSVVFGPVSTTGNTDTTATFSVTCSTLGLALGANTKVRLCLSIGDGNNGIGYFNPRRMTNGTGDPLDFQLYRDPARTQIWGSRGNPTLPIPLGADFDYSVLLLGASQTRTFTIHGRVPLAQAQALNAGAYSNPFTGIHTRMDYRYNETIIGTANYPANCTSGGVGGNSVSGAFPFTASATVPTQCHAYATAPLDFGSVPGTITSAVDQTSTITMTCTGRTAWKVGLNNGLHANGNTRRMRLGSTSNFVNYELYREPARTSRWGTALGTDTLDGTGNGAAQTLTVYGRVPAPQTPAAGSYGDTVTVTITY